MRRSVLLILVVLLAAGCGGGTSDRATSSPGASAPATAQVASTRASPPIATPTAIATVAPVLRTTGKLIFLRGKDLWVANLDGSGERQITNGSFGAGFAGYTRDAAGNAELYYTSEISQTSISGSQRPTAAEFAAYRVSLDGGPGEQLFMFRGTMKHDEFSAELASVSPDGKHIAYSDEGGIHRFDLEDERREALLENVPCDDPGHASGCHGFYKPDWSPSGDLLLAQEVFFEGMQFVTVQPLDPSNNLREIAPPFEYDAAAWSPEGRRLCFVPANAQGTGRVLTIDGNQWIDLRPPPEAGTIACAWAENGQLAIEYLAGTDQQTRHVAVFDASLALQTTVDIAPTPVGSPRTVTWLPDGSGFLIQRWDAAAGAPTASAVMLDGTTRRLPFVANHVLAAIP